MSPRGTPLKTEPILQELSTAPRREHLAAVLSRAVQVSLEIWNSGAHHGERLALGPACVGCEQRDARAFDRCRKRRSYLMRPEVDAPESLAEKCPLKVRLARQGPGGGGTGTTLYTFGYPTSGSIEETDARVMNFMADMRALLRPQSGHPAGAAEGVSADLLAFFQPLAPSLPWAAPLQCLRAGNLASEARAKHDFTTLLAAFVSALEARASSQNGHSVRVRLLALLLGQEMGLCAEELEALHWASYLHGAAALGTTSLHAGEACALDTAPESPDTSHDSIWEPLRTLGDVQPVIDILRHQRTRWDGLEPPQSAERDIPRAARCLAVADALDILMASDPNRRPRRLHVGIEALALGAGTRFDPAVIEALRRLEPRLESHAWIFLLARHPVPAAVR